MRISEFRIGVDFDEVIYPWYARAHRACEIQGIIPSTFQGVPVTWFPYEEYGITKQKWLRAIGIAATDGYLYSASPMDGAVEALHELKGAGCALYVVTARGNGTLPNASLIRQLTDEYIEKWDLPIDGIAYTRDKEAVARSLGLTHAIDDHLLNYEAFEAAGATAYLHDQPWNLLADFPVRRVPSLAAFAERVLQKASV